MKKYISIITVLVVLTSSQNFAQTKLAQILVGPNIQVSKDGNFTHEEFMLAANPKDPDNLLGGTHASSRFDVESRLTKAYVTKDGGGNWNDISFPEFDGYDPQVAFGLHGTAYFVALTSNKKYQMSFCRSEDGGTTWGKPVSLSDNLYGLSKEFDYEKIVVDQTFGKFAGRIYISAMTTEMGKYLLCLFRSDDDGKSFVGPMKVVSGNEGKGMNTTNLLVSSKGTLFFTHDEWFNDKSLPNSFDGFDVFILSSNNGGVSFSQPMKVIRSKLYLHPKFAIDNKSEKYKDRIYCVYDDTQNKVIMLTYSTDEGKTWSEPKMVDTNLPKGASQSHSDVTVNPQGVVGIRWFDTRNKKIVEPGADGLKDFDEYFTASIDGGETFLPSVKISTETSLEPKMPKPGEIGIPSWKRIHDNSLLLSFQSAIKMLGDHYYQFTSDATGVFHDFWSDSRDGKARQVYTATIKVITPDEDAKKVKIEFEKKYKREEKKFNLSPKNKVLSQISKKIFLNIDESNYDTTKHILSIPVRVKNISDKPIFGPINLKISKVDTSEGRNTIPLIINSDNKMEGVGAQYKYSLSNSKVLLPGEETETLIWKFKVKIPKEKRELLSKEQMYLFNKMTDEQMKMFNNNSNQRIDKNYMVTSGTYPELISVLQINVTGYLSEEKQ